MNKKILKRILLLILGIIIIGGSYVLYIFMQPHRDVQATTTDYQMEAKVLVNEYLADAKASNNKYLDEEGESKIIEVTGTIAEISKDMNSQNVVLLKSEGEDAGVSCTFLATTNTSHLKVGDIVTIKGVIRSGAGYDEDLELFEDVIMEKCDLITK
jgi:hypothetical protein